MAETHLELQARYAEGRRAWGAAVAARDTDGTPAAERSKGRPLSHKDPEMTQTHRIAAQTLCDEDTGRGYNMTTASGRPFWPLDPQPEDIRFGDIANGLSRLCRYNGQLHPCVEHYSVAQHSVLVSLHVPPEFALEALLHDAAEAYVGDMVRPLKLKNDQYRNDENLVDSMIRAKFDLPSVCSDVVKAADNVACATEKRDLLTETNGVDWGSLPEPWPAPIKPLNAFAARDLFFARALELGLGE